MTNEDIEQLSSYEDYKRLWQNKNTGQVFYVRYVIDCDGYVHIMQAAGPLHYDQYDAALSGDIEDNPVLARVIDHTQTYYHELQQPHKGVLNEDIRHDL
jgi:hypothetical protein